MGSVNRVSLFRACLPVYVVSFCILAIGIHFWVLGLHFLFWTAGVRVSVLLRASLSLCCMSILCFLSLTLWKRKKRLQDKQKTRKGPRQKGICDIETRTVTVCIGDETDCKTEKCEISTLLQAQPRMTVQHTYQDRDSFPNCARSAETVTSSQDRLPVVFAVTREYASKATQLANPISRQCFRTPLTSCPRSLLPTSTPHSEATTAQLDLKSFSFTVHSQRARARCDC